VCLHLSVGLHLGELQFSGRLSCLACLLLVYKYHLSNNKWLMWRCGWLAGGISSVCLAGSKVARGATFKLAAQPKARGGLLCGEQVANRWPFACLGRTVIRGALVWPIVGLAGWQTERRPIGGWRAGELASHQAQRGKQIWPRAIGAASAELARLVAGVLRAPRVCSRARRARCLPPHATCDKDKDKQANKHSAQTDCVPPLLPVPTNQKRRVRL